VKTFWGTFIYIHLQTQWKWRLSGEASFIHLQTCSDLKDSVEVKTLWGSFFLVYAQAQVVPPNCVRTNGGVSLMT
jgi:hypothetical protein